MDHYVLVIADVGCGRSPDYVACSTRFDADDQLFADRLAEAFVDLGVQHAIEFARLLCGECSNAAHITRARQVCEAYDVTSSDFEGMHEEVKECLVPLIREYKGGHPDVFLTQLSKKFRIGGINYCVLIKDNDRVYDKLVDGGVVVE